MNKPSLIAIALLIALSITSACNNAATATNNAAAPAKAVTKPAANEAPEWFLLRPEVEKQYGYSHAVRIGDDLKISGAVSMDDKGELTAKGDLEQQMKNCYADLGLKALRLHV